MGGWRRREEIRARQRSVSGRRSLSAADWARAGIVATSSAISSRSWVVGSFKPAARGISILPALGEQIGEIRTELATIPMAPIHDLESFLERAGGRRPAR